MIFEVWEGQPFSLPSLEDGHKIKSLLGGLVNRSGDDWTISRVVGHLRLGPDRYIWIRSRKAKAATMMSWLAFVDPHLRALQHLGHIPDVGNSGDVTGALAWLYCQQLHTLAQRTGLLKRYQQQPIVSSVVRGRIEFAEMTRKARTLARLPCLIPERIHDTKLNQLLSAALQVIGRDWWLRKSAGIYYNHCATLLQGVLPVVDQPLLTGRTSLNRLECAFEPVLVLARLLLSGNGLGEGNARDGIGFILNLESLFERTVSRAFIEAGVPHREQAPLSYGRGGDLDGGQFNVDLLVTSSPPVVVDAKFRSAVSSSTLQQMVTYCVMSGARRAVLVLPSGHQADQLDYRFTVAPSWGTGEIRVSVVELKTDGQDLAAWRDNGQAMVNRVLELSGLGGPIGTRVVVANST